MGIKPCPNPAKWTERDGNKQFEGQVIDEVAVEEDFEFGDYCKVIQLLKEENSEPITQFGYYVKLHGSDDKEYK